jgi:hypothetical protein
MSVWSDRAFMVMPVIAVSLVFVPDDRHSVGLANL